MTWASAMDPQLATRAFALAAELHRDQVRKGTQVAYLSHLMAVAALVAEDDGTASAVLAALLHDAAEDQGGEATLVLIQNEIGSGVAEIVRQCSDSILDEGEKKNPWRERKELAVANLDQCSPDALLVIAADKLHNTRATQADLDLEGPRVWDRFKTGRDGFLWYHRAMADALVRLAPASRSARLLRREVDHLEFTAAGPTSPN